MTDTKQLKDEELKQVTGGAYLDDNDLTEWKFSPEQVLYGHSLTNFGTPTYTIKITILECIVMNGAPGYKVRIYDQVQGPRFAEWTEAYLLGKDGSNFELE